VTVGVSQANSTRFFVIGQVTKPGDFPLSGRITVLQGLALAGGLKEFARADSIVIIRTNPDGSQAFVPVNYKKLEEAKDIAQNVQLRPGDTIVVP
jgi:polysaccharide export outer membrane protein